MSKQRKPKRIQIRTQTMRVDFFQARPGLGADHMLELTLNGSHNGHIVKTKATLDLGDIPNLTAKLHDYVATEQRKVNIARDALAGPSQNGAQAKP